MKTRELSRNFLLALLASALPGLAAGATVASDAQTLGASAALNQRLPAACGFTVPAAGQVQVTLTDLANPVAFTQLRLVVSREADKVASLSAPGVQVFAAQAGVYKVQVVGTPGTPPGGGDAAGAYDVVVRAVPGNTLLGTCPGGIVAATRDPAQSDLNTTFQIAQAGTYQVTLNDRSFPAALANVQLLLSREDSTGTAVIIGPSCVVTCTQSLLVNSPGTYRLLVFAAAGSPLQAGLYSISISGGPGNATIYSATQPVGRLPAPTSIALTAGGYTLSSSDVAVPAALAELRVVLTQGATLLGSLAAQGSVAVTAMAGNAQLFVFTRTGSGAGAGAGVYAVGLAQGVQSIYRDLRVSPEGFDGAVSTGGYRYAFTVPAAGDYRLQLRDLAFPTQFAQLRTVLVQNGVVLQSLTGVTTGVTVPLAAGPAFIALLGTTPTATANSLLGVSLAPLVGGIALLDQAQGIGPLFATRTVNIPVAGSYDLVVNDLNFPVAFADLAVAVTQGTNLIGQVFGSGRVRFTAQAGTHSINLLARPDATAQYSTWGFALADSPPAPTVTLDAAPASVVRDSKATLTWSSTNATSCTATGGWTGTRALSGTESSAALATDSTFTLSCTGDGGTTTKSATVTVSAAPAPGSSGGGGSLGASGVLLLTTLLYALRRQQRGRLVKA